MAVSHDGFIEPHCLEGQQVQCLSTSCSALHRTLLLHITPPPSEVNLQSVGDQEQTKNGAIYLPLPCASWRTIGSNRFFLYSGRSRNSSLVGGRKREPQFPIGILKPPARALVCLTGKQQHPGRLWNPDLNVAVSSKKKNCKNNESYRLGLGHCHAGGMGV